jgi:hypothetical protein
MSAGTCEAAERLARGSFSLTKTFTARSPVSVSAEYRKPTPTPTMFSIPIRSTCAVACARATMLNPPMRLISRSRARRVVLRRNERVERALRPEHLRTGPRCVGIVLQHVRFTGPGWAAGMPRILDRSAAGT